MTEPMNDSPQEPAPTRGEPVIWWKIAFGLLALCVLVTLVSLNSQRGKTADANDERDAIAVELATVKDDLDAATSDLESTEAAKSSLQATVSARAAACDDLGAAIDDYDAWVSQLLDWVSSSIDAVSRPYSSYDVEGNGNRLLSQQLLVIAAVSTARDDCIGTTTGGA